MKEMRLDWVKYEGHDISSLSGTFDLNPKSFRIRKVYNQN
ncbi:hypothetical protein CLV41_111223 [Roseibium marinum]|uniref:Uncharacterized protein n=1 Tax=Roseibium marinum TaxID=281252 RepID=A0A2S3UMR2_9HYPH|nr:hypothetical protein CLV41_111223 [Roseibium marinum]